MMSVILYIIFLNLNIIFNSVNLISVFLFNLLMMLMIYFMTLNMSGLGWFNLYNNLGMDSINFFLMILSLWIISMMFMVSLNINFSKLFGFILIQLLIFLMMSFLTMNYFIFYLFSLVYSLNYLFLLNYENLSLTINEFCFYLFMLMAFMIKLPLFMFHMWLPKAHIEAPVSGSMILAGVMLKLDGYGIIRSMLIMKKLSIKFNYLFMVIGLVGFIYLSLVCLRFYDMKLIVAYSSVVHMSVMLMGIMSMMSWGVNGGLLMMIGHGICSSALFALINFFYMRSKTRNMMINKGMMSVLPTLTMWWFLFCIINMSAPISLNLLSELMIINIMLSWSSNIILFLMLGMFMSATYSFFLFCYIQHGKFSSMFFKIYSMKVNDYLLLILHWIWN